MQITKVSKHLIVLALCLIIFSLSPIGYADECSIKSLQLVENELLEEIVELHKFDRAPSDTIVVSFFDREVLLPNRFSQRFTGDKIQFQGSLYKKEYMGCEVTLMQSGDIFYRKIELCRRCSLLSEDGLRVVRRQLRPDLTVAEMFFDQDQPLYIIYNDDYALEIADPNPRLATSIIEQLR